MLYFMKKNYQIAIIALFVFAINYGQEFNAGYTIVSLKDKSRTYKPKATITDSLYYRPIDLDIWYPSNQKGEQVLTFGYLFKQLELRANKYQEETDYSGVTEELAQFFVAEMGVSAKAKHLLDIKTNSFLNVKPSQEKYPLIIYMSGINGMGFENYKILENLAKNGFIVVSISSIGRYPGDMTNEIGDTLEQVYDAEFALKYLRNNSNFDIDFNNIGVLACSWGGISTAILTNKNQDIKAMVSLDGTETHYFGEELDTNLYANGATTEENDQFIREIQDTMLLNVGKQNIKYLYFESGDKLDEFTPTGEYHYFKKLTSEKYYLRFTNSLHADFTCIPSILKSSKHSVAIYENIEGSTISFFNKTLGKKDVFNKSWQRLLSLDYTTDETYDISKKTEIIENISGKIIDAKTKAPIPYVNIGILNGTTGTVTDKKGAFMLEIKDQSVNDTLRISMIGYKPVELLIKDIKPKKQFLSIKLEEEISKLNEVVVTAKVIKKKVLGNKTKSKFLNAGFSYDQLGAEMGIKINIRKTPTFVDAFNFNISQNRLSTRSIFRLNFYSIKNRKPFENILNENILAAIKPKQTGLITVDLKPYDIVLNDDVIVTLEWVDNDGENKKHEAIFFSLGLMANGTLHKESSQAKFRKFGSLGVGFNINVRY